MILATIDLAQELDCFQIAVRSKRWLSILLMNSRYIRKIDQDVWISFAK